MEFREIAKNHIIASLLSSRQYMEEKSRASEEGNPDKETRPKDVFYDLTNEEAFLNELETDVDLAHSAFNYVEEGGDHRAILKKVKELRKDLGSKIYFGCCAKAVENIEKRLGKTVDLLSLEEAKAALQEFLSSLRRMLFKEIGIDLKFEKFFHKASPSNEQILVRINTGLAENAKNAKEVLNELGRFTNFKRFFGKEPAAFTQEEAKLALEEIARYLESPLKRQDAKW